MYKIDNLTSTAVMPTPAAPGPNPGSYFTEGNASSGIAATIVTADWANAVQQEICTAVTGYGLTLSKSDSTQLYQAMRLINRSSSYDNATGSPSNYTITPVPAATSYYAGMQFYIKFTNANTGASTLNVSSLGTVPIVNTKGLPLVVGDIHDGMIANVVCDGSNFQLLNNDLIKVADIQNNTYNYAASTTAANTYTASVTPAPLAYVAGQFFYITFTNANTSATVTVNINSLGAKTVKRVNGAALYIGDIRAGMTAQLFYDGTNLQLLNPWAPKVVLQDIVVKLAATATGTALIPYDNTPPLSSEGTEIITSTITPLFATSRIDVEFICWGSSSAVNWLILALFQDSGASSICTASNSINPAAYNTVVPLIWSQTAGTTSATTFKIRAGTVSAGTWYINFSTGVAFGNTTNANFKITEYQV